MIIGRVADRCGRNRANQQVARQTPRGGGGERQHEHPKNIQLVFDPRHRSAERENERADQIERYQ
jgi:hypothetical protein